MSFELPPLPYAKDALMPHISPNTFDYHYGKHHQAYVTNLNGLIKDTDFAGSTLEDIIMATHHDASKIGVFNNAAQVWNHTFFWNCMTPQGGGEPSAAFKTKLEETFGSFDQFKADFKQAALTQFGSGWAWLVADRGELKITKTPNAQLPMMFGQTALMTVDVWEHAYYLDYQNRRPDFVQAFLDHLVNWSFVEQNLAAA